jgi:penicillin-binding protein A
LSTAIGFGCPAPLNDLASEMDWAGFVKGLEKYGFFESLALPLVLAQGVQADTLVNDNELRTQVLGQGNMTISPMEMAWALSTIANGGERLPLQLVQRVESNEAGWEVVIPSEKTKYSRISQQTIEQVKNVMLESVASGAAQNAHSDKVRIAGHVGIAVTGPEIANHSWFLGFTPTENSQNTGRYVVVVLLEEVDDAALAAGIGGRVLEAAAD